MTYFVYTEIPVVIEPSDMQQFIVNEQSELTITCTASGSPAPDIVFYNNSQMISNERVTLGTVSYVLNSTTNLYMASRNLTLTNAMDRDSGSLVCSASSDIPMHGMRIRNVSFSILVHSEF